MDEMKQAKRRERYTAMLPKSHLADFAADHHELLRAYKAAVEMLQGVMEICGPYTDKATAGKLVSEISNYIQVRAPELTLHADKKRAALSKAQREGEG